MKAGSLATETCEPRQVRKEATVNRTLWAPRESLARAASGDTPKGDRRREVRGLLMFMARITERIHSPASSASGRRRKALGQHFLTDTSILDRIVDASELSSDDAAVEVGPGKGVLTRRLVGKCRSVTAVEMDRTLADSLPARLGHPNNLTVIAGDGREIDLAALTPNGERYKLVANLPYYAASPILRRFLEAGDRQPTLLVVMLQEEVARSMEAADGRMSLLAVSVHLYGAPSIVCRVPPAAFEPPPKVSSAVIKIVPHQVPALELDDVDAFFGIVKAGFSSPRKRIRNSLAIGLGIGPGEAERTLSKAGIDPVARPENLTLNDWRSLYIQTSGASANGS